MTSAAELANMLESDRACAPYFRGCYNRLDMIISPIIDLNEKNIFVYLVNQHFCALIIHPEQSYYIDPLGQPPPADLMPTVQRWAMPYRHVPNRRVQSEHSQLCAIYVYYFCQFLCRQQSSQEQLPFTKDLRQNEILLLQWYRQHWPRRQQQQQQDGDRRWRRQAD